MRWAAARTSALLSLLFIVVYGGMSWITAHRADVGTLYFEWERQIPLIPWLIIPYMSIDLFFVAAPFLCSGDSERRLFSKRVTFCILVAGAFFLVMPLRYAFPRPVVTGNLGGIFRFLHSFDQPYNLFPSLHIALRTILADLYSRHTRGPLRWASLGWFSLVGFSTVFTWQHHVLDVAGGFALAALAFYVIPGIAGRLPVLPNRRIGLYYALGCLAVLAGAIGFWPWGSLLLWPALSLGIVAAAYFGLGPSVYRKAEGRLPLSARVVLAPVLLGQGLSLLYYRMRCRPWDPVTPNVWIGRHLSHRKAAGAVKAGVTAVVDLTVEFSEPEPFLATHYLHLPVLDLTAPTPAQMEEAAAFIDHYARSGTVYVHCKIGYSRSAAVLGAYLLKSGAAATPEQAVERLRAARPSLVVRPEAFEALCGFHASLPS